eukprot:m.30813 g.30813  ORF g.30813 m.30813 type:complete len:99 (+) comp31401_c0_seq1:522-818(+)
MLPDTVGWSLGDKLLERKEMVSFSPDQLYCVGRQLKMPLADTGEYDPSSDLGHMYSFVYELTYLRVSPSLKSVSQSCLAFDISPFHSLTHLKASTCFT